MFTIKRVKTALDADGSPKGPAKTHFATAVAAAGNVTGWTDKPEHAAQFDEATAERVEDFYDAKAELGSPVGKVTTHRVPGSDPKPEPKSGTRAAAPPRPPQPPAAPPAPPVPPSPPAGGKPEDKKPS